jgi:hypothetical protein
MKMVQWDIFKKTRIVVCVLDINGLLVLPILDLYKVVAE